MKKNTGRKTASMAATADRHRLYELAVQDPVAECRFVHKTFRKLRGRTARVLREDFCGTAAVSCEWVRRDKANTATGVDLDQNVLEWGRTHNVSKLKPAQQLRVKLLQEDVLSVSTQPPADLVLAMNFSYMTFKTRDLMRSYFSQARKGLADDGVLMLDVFGGYEAWKEMREVTKHKGFRYIWEHASINPVSNDILCHIHFKFPDGSKMKKAFSYDWRLWTLPELRELLVEAGFARATVYWEEYDADTGEGLGVYQPTEQGDADPGWVCFIVAEK